MIRNVIQLVVKIFYKWRTIYFFPKNRNNLFNAYSTHRVATPANKILNKSINTYTCWYITGLLHIKYMRLVILNSNIFSTVPEVDSNIYPHLFDLLWIKILSLIFRMKTNDFPASLCAAGKDVDISKRMKHPQMICHLHMFLCSSMGEWL